MKPQRALIVATVCTLLIALGAVVLVSAMNSPSAGSSETTSISTETPLATGGDSPLLVKDVSGKSVDRDEESADQSDTTGTHDEVDDDDETETGESHDED